MTIITVTADHIRRGKRKESRMCPVALAITDALPGDMTVHAGDEYMLLQSGSTIYLLGKLPPEVTDFIFRFDHGDAVHPFSFTLAFP